MVSAGIVVALLAVLIDVLLAGVQRLIVSPGVSGRFSRHGTRPDAMTASLAEVAVTHA